MPYVYFNLRNPPKWLKENINSIYVNKWVKMPLFAHKIENNKEIQYKDSNNSYLLRDYVDY